MQEKPNMEKPNLSKYVKGQFSLTPEEIQKAKQKGDLVEQQKRMQEATEEIQKAGVLEIPPEEEKNAEKNLKEGLKEVRQIIKKAQEQKK